MNDNVFNSHASDIIRRFSPESVNTRNIDKIANNVNDMSADIASIRNDVSRLNKEVINLHNDLAAETQRAISEEKKTRRLAFLLSILGFLLGALINHILEFLFSLW